MSKMMSLNLAELQNSILSLPSTFIKDRSDDLLLNIDSSSHKSSNVSMEQDFSPSRSMENGVESLQQSEKLLKLDDKIKLNVKNDAVLSRERTRESLSGARAGSFLYEVAKPKPPPRNRKTSRIVVATQQTQLPLLTADGDESDMKTSLLDTVEHVETESDTHEFETTEAALIACGTQLDSVNSAVLTKLEDDLPNNQSDYLTITSVSQTKTNAKNSPGLSQVTMKNDSSSNTNSSGYYSLKSGSTSLSSSNSNASSTNSTKFPLATTSGNPSGLLTTAGRHSSTTKITPSNNEEINLTSAEDEDDVFPIKSWIESPEYAIIAQKQTTEIENISDVAESSVVVSSHVPQQSEEALTSRMTTNVKSHHSSDKKRHHEPRIVNSISMVEHSHPTESNTKKNIFSSSVKLRMPKPRTSKNEATRSSRAFALKLKQLNEDSSDIKDSSLERVMIKREPGKVTSENKTHDSRDSVAHKQLNHDENLFKAPLPPRLSKVIQLTEANKGLSASLGQLNELSSSEKAFNTISGATGRHLSERSTFFNDQVNKYKYSKRNSVAAEATPEEGSTWSLSYQDVASPNNNSSRRPSVKNKIKNAFSFQNIRRAISVEKLNENQRSKSQSNSYLNEFGQDISELPSNTLNHKNTPKPASLHKAPSISSIFSTVRMRKRKSRERRAAKARHTIAVDSRLTESLSNISVQDQSDAGATIEDDIGSPGYYGSIGRVLQMNVKEETMVIEIKKPSTGPFGFYIARNKETGSIYISSISDSYPNKMYTGLMKLGDEIIQVNGVKVEHLTLDQIYDIIFESKTLKLHVKPSQIHVV